MKNLKWLLMLPLAGILLSVSCKKESLNQLPPATQEGKRTFGCLVNGKVYTPKGSPFAGPILSSYYQYLNTSTTKGYFFNLSVRKDNDGFVEGISINSNALEIKEGEKYILNADLTEGQVNAAYRIVSNGEVNRYTTNNIYKGELHITRLDDTKQIVSGTFWFDAVNDKGEKVEVREGRFDMVYSK